VIICKKCGNRNEDRDQFCTSCGSFLEWSGERVVETAPDPPPPQVAPPPPPPPPPPPTFIEHVKQVVGMEAGQAPRQQAGGWVPPATVAATTATQPEVSTGLPTARRPDAPAPPAEVPKARQPEEAPIAPPPPPKIVPAMVPEVNEVGTFCSTCGAGNDVRRHFCRRCGAPLMRGAVASRPSWWQRWLQRRREASAGDRPFREETTFGSLVRTFLITMLLVVLIGGIFAYLALPGFRAAVNREIDIAVTDVRRLINPSYVQVHPVTTNASSEVTGHPGQLAADLINNDYWAADLTRDREPTLTVTFDGPTDLDAIVVTNGAAPSDYPRLARPKVLQISYSDGTGEQVTLNDDPHAIAYVIHARGVTSMTVRVVSVYPGQGSSEVGLAEIEFRRLA
jgi:ribosomal protein L40E